MSFDTIAVLGLGIIGSRVASHLEKAGQVRTWNRTPKGLPTEAASVEEAIADADLVCLYLKDAPATREVLQYCSDVINKHRVSPKLDNPGRPSNARQAMIAGQAASHCVKSTIDDLLDEIAAKDITLAKKVYLVTDCMSAVTVPDGKGGLAVDFTAAAEAALARFADAGMRLVRSTDPIASWPGL